MNKKTVILCLSIAVLASAITAFATTKNNRNNQPPKLPNFEQTENAPKFGDYNNINNGQRTQPPKMKPDKKPGGDMVPPEFDSSAGSNLQGQRKQQDFIDNNKQ